MTTGDNRWRRPTNVYRTRWNIKGVPTMVRYREVDGEVTEDGRFEGSDVLGVEAMLDSLVAGEPFT